LAVSETFTALEKKQESMQDEHQMTTREQAEHLKTSFGIDTPAGTEDSGLITALNLNQAASKSWVGSFRTHSDALTEEAKEYRAWMVKNKATIDKDEYAAFEKLQDKDDEELGRIMGKELSELEDDDKEGQEAFYKKYRIRKDSPTGGIPFNAAVDFYEASSSDQVNAFDVENVADVQKLITNMNMPAISRPGEAPIGDGAAAGGRPPGDGTSGGPVNVKGTLAITGLRTADLNASIGGLHDVANVG